MEMMTPTIVDHQRKIDELDRDHPDRPNDFLAWLIENANGDRSRTEPKILTEWIKTLNLASIDSSSIVRHPYHPDLRHNDFCSRCSHMRCTTSPYTQSASPRFATK